MKTFFSFLALSVLASAAQAQEFAYRPPKNYHLLWNKKVYEGDDVYRYGFFENTPWGFYSVYSDTASYDSSALFSIVYFAERAPVESQAQMAYDVFEDLPADSLYETELLDHPRHMWVSLLNSHGNNLWFAEKYKDGRRARIYYDDEFQSFYIEVDDYVAPPPLFIPDPDPAILALFEEVGFELSESVPGLYPYKAETVEISTALLAKLDAQGWMVDILPVEEETAKLGRMYTLPDGWVIFYFLYEDDQGLPLAQGGLFYPE
jgi:hypothetical protein